MLKRPRAIRLKMVRKKHLDFQIQNQAFEPQSEWVFCVYLRVTDFCFICVGQDCKYGDNCCWGHICPKGPTCYHHSRGKCWFKGGKQIGYFCIAIYSCGLILDNVDTMHGITSQQQSTSVSPSDAIDNLLEGFVRM